MNIRFYKHKFRDDNLRLSAISIKTVWIFININFIKYIFFFFALIVSTTINAQSWQDVAGGTNNSSHGMCLWNGMLVDAGSFNNPCNRVGTWDGTSWGCLGTGVGLVARAAIEFNGDLIVCGDFWNVQQPCVGCNGIAKWDGISWTPLGTGFNNDVLCMTIWNGDLIAGGDFSTADGNSVSKVARWTGTTWEPIGGTSDFSNDIRTLIVYDGELWAGGDFANVGGCTACDGLVKWDGTAWIGGDFGVDITGGVDSTIRVLYVDPSTNLLYMGGHFIELNLDGVINTDCNAVAVYDGSNWTPLGTGVNSYVRAIHAYNGNIIVGGDFNTAGAIAANKIAKWNSVTSTWSAMGTGMNDYVKSMAVYNGDLYAGGPFTTADGLTRNCIAKWYEVPTVAPIAIINASSTTICPGQCINFTDNSLNSPTGWTWSFPGGVPSSSTNQNPGSVCFANSGSYNVTLTACNSNGCNTSTQIITVVNAPDVSVNNLTICYGQSGNLNSTGATTYTWSPGIGLSDTTGSTVIASPTVTTTYTVIGTGAGGCTSTALATVTVNSIPVVTVNNLSICLGVSDTLFATGAIDFVWSPPTGLSNTIGAMVIANPTITTTYTVTGTTGGCSQTAMASVIINSTPGNTISANGPTTFCEGDSVLLTASIGDNYLWNTSAVSQSILITTSGTYSVQVTNSNGCTSTAGTTVNVNPFPDVSITFTGNSITANLSGANYQWVDCNNNFVVIIGETGQSFTPTANGSYAVIVQQNGCSDTSACQVISNVGINELTDQNNLVLYPNPATDFINFETYQTSRMIIYDMYGRCLMNTILLVGKQIINIGYLTAGIYFVELETETGSLKKTLIKNK